MRFFCVIFCFLLWFSNASSQSDPENDTVKWPTLIPEYSYCYEFTWFGPDYNNASRYNGTCADYLEDTRAKDIPCSSPVVITSLANDLVIMANDPFLPTTKSDGTINDNGNSPNMDYLWDKHRSSILCVRGTNQRCVKYTYYFDNKINNVTHMCAKVQSVEGSVVDSGCYKEKTVNGYQREVCVCKSSPGIYPPCNGVTNNTMCLSIIIFSLFYQFIIKTIC